MAVATQLFDGVYEADVDHSSLEAGTRHMGVGSFRTRFEDVSARLLGDASGVRLEGSAPVASIAIRQPPELREHVVNGTDFFDASHYPAIRFSSSEITLGDDGAVELAGQLTIKDVTREVAASGSYRPPTEDLYGGMRAAIDLSTTIDRRDFGMDWQSKLPNGGNALEWDVEIDIHLELKKAMPATIGRDELEAAIDAGEVTLVETLRTEHFKQGHLPGAIHIHFEEVGDRAHALLPDKDAPIVTYCSNTACQNSSIAADRLAAMGYTNVRKYADGKQDWQEAGLPLEGAQ